jgi:hypothetical protein
MLPNETCTVRHHILTRGEYLSLFVPGIYIKKTVILRKKILLYTIFCKKMNLGIWCLKKGQKIVNGLLLCHHSMIVKLKEVVTDRTLGLAELFGRTSTVQFGPNDRTFFCRRQNFFFLLYSMPMASFHIFVSLNDPHVRGVIIGL